VVLVGVGAVEAGEVEARDAWAGPPPQGLAVIVSARSAARSCRTNAAFPASTANARSAGRP
jgi:hypothetical protein